MKTLRLGTRGSRLALKQAELAISAIRRVAPDWAIEICVVKTSGDKDQVRSLVNLGGTGVFVKELEEHLLSGEIDFAVHSLKDVPENMHPKLCLAGFLLRALPNDTLLSRGKKLSELPLGAKIGTGSPRRILQLKALRPDLSFLDLRGNLDSRIGKVKRGELDAIILGGAGLCRLELSHEISEVFSPEILTPAIGQGIVCLQCLSSNEALREILQEAGDKESAQSARTERTWMRFLGGGCRVPMAAFLEKIPEGFRFYAYLSDVKSGRFFRDSCELKEDFSEDYLLETFGKNFIRECAERKIPLPKEVDEHSLLDFWGKS